MKVLNITLRICKVRLHKKMLVLYCAGGNTSDKHLKRFMCLMKS